jgi:hypothetical protein
MIENNTRNQHFVTQGEQRLNALNPEADPRNQRIYWHLGIRAATKSA